MPVRHDFAEQHRAYHIDAYDAAATIADQIPAREPVIVSCGGGGLFAGVTVALTGRNPVLAAEPESAPTLSAALAAGAPVDVNVSEVAVDSLGARRASTLLVPDTAITATTRLLRDRLRIHAEGGAVTGLAAVLHHHPAIDTTAITAVISGANGQ